ncbi:MAG TPA: prepilin-type N-terminal cleavage/methylation domain-containing protein [Candidatus Hydrogenedentes bacterium]|nr:prepilin-type N-terminal cleavage/methylation domain-containing protein [Candidatus Hydrogenedentota bacterium]
MIAKGKHRAAGLSLPELVVAITIIAVMAVVAIPTFSRLGVFSRSELRNTARTVHSLLKAARVYAATYRVDTAVVYVMDNWVDPPFLEYDDFTETSPPLIQMLNDSVSGGGVRVLRAAAIMYKMPRYPRDFCQQPPCARVETTEDERGYVSMGRPESVFQEFPGRMVIPLVHPITLESVFPLDVAYLANKNAGGQLAELGLTPVKVWLRGGPYNPPRAMIKGDINDCGIPDSDRIEPDANQWAWLPAHVFNSAGQLKVDAGKERYVILVAPSPDESPHVRLVDPERERALGNLIHIPIEIYRATGRVKVAS